MPPSCVLLGGFAIGTLVSLLWQHRANAKCQRVLVLALCLVKDICEGISRHTMSASHGEITTYSNFRTSDPSHQWSV